MQSEQRLSPARLASEFQLSNRGKQNASVALDVWSVRIHGIKGVDDFPLVTEGSYGSRRQV